MYRTMMVAIAAALARSPALAQQPAAPAPAATPGPAPQPARDVPFARVMSDGALVRGIDSKDRILLQLGKFVLLCRQGDGRLATCDLVN